MVETEKTSTEALRATGFQTLASGLGTRKNFDVLKKCNAEIAASATKVTLCVAQEFSNLVVTCWKMRRTGNTLKAGGPRVGAGPFRLTV
jgi:hypothetical protein